MTLMAMFALRMVWTASGLDGLVGREVRLVVFWSPVEGRSGEFAVGLLVGIPVADESRWTPLRRTFMVAQTAELVME
jgi:hypothetical protein